MRIRAVAILLVACSVGLAACDGDEPGDDAATDTGGEEDVGWCCPYDEPSPGDSCTGTCKGCIYSDGRCRRAPIYDCVDGSWEQTGRTRRHPACFEDGGVDGGSDADTGGGDTGDAGGDTTSDLGDAVDAPTDGG